MSEGAETGRWFDGLRERLIRIINGIDIIVDRLGPKPRPTRLSLELPTLTRKGIPMANFPLQNDAVYVITIKGTNSAGAFEPLPAGDTFTVTCSDLTSIGVAIGADAAGNPAVIATPLKQLATGVSITVTDAHGLTSPPMLFDVVADTTVTALTLDAVDATHTPQAVPPN